MLKYFKDIWVKKKLEKEDEDYWRLKNDMKNHPRSNQSFEDTPDL